MDDNINPAMKFIHEAKSRVHGNRTSGNTRINGEEKREMIASRREKEKREEEEERKK